MAEKVGNRFVLLLAVIITLVYLVMPDLFPGPIDDVVVTLLLVGGANKRIANE